MVTFREDYPVPSFHQFLHELSDPRPYLRIRLIQLDRNRRQLLNIPYQTYLDLAAVCELSIQTDDLDGTALIHRQHLHAWGLTEKELFDCAWKNTYAARIPILKPVDYPLLFLEEIELEPALDTRLHQIYEHWLSQMSNPSCPLFAITNRQNLHGAACILYPDVLRMISDAMESDLYLIPSSIHEMLITPVIDTDLSGILTEILEEVNIETVLSTEILGTHLYYYERTSRRLRSVPDDLSPALKL